MNLKKKPTSQANSLIAQQSKENYEYFFPFLLHLYLCRFTSIKKKNVKSIFEIKVNSKKEKKF